VPEPEFVFRLISTFYGGMVHSHSSHQLSSDQKELEVQIFWQKSQRKGIGELWSVLVQSL